MKIKTSLALLLSSSSLFAGGLLFHVESKGDVVNVPVTLCLSGVSEMSCQKYTLTGRESFIKTLTTNTTEFPQAGIKSNVAGYKFEGCTQHTNGYCIFHASSNKLARIGVKKY